MVRDAIDQMLRRLENIEALLREDINPETDNVESDKPNPQNTSQYFSTGPDKLAVEKTGDDWTRLNFGLRAHTINLRTDDEINIAFKKPDNNPGRQMKIRAHESPFTIGGDSGIDSRFMWVQQGEGASDTPGVQIIAFR